MRTKLIVGSLLALTALSASAALLDSVNIPKTPQQEAKIELGKMLWFDPRLSLSGKVSCNTCHDLSTNGADTKPLSIGYAGRKGTVNSPTVFNAEKQIAQFWDGRAKTLAEQATGPITNPLEMAMTPELAEGVIRSIPGYRPYFEKAFGSKNPTFSEIAEALAAFETTLTTPNAPFERYLKGDKNALTQQQIDGLKLFRRSGCIRCHSGNLLGGTSFQKVGSVRPYVTDNPSKGRMDVSGKPWDEMMFKVPTLLNVERTAPYFHDGAVKTLPDAVKKMADIQLDMNLSEKQVEEIVAFLDSLNGELPKIEKPTLPPSGPETRKYIEEVY
ncbi:cytochrome c peroxidase [uncultured Parasutterella sp.]|uniref:cytochrome-c peroxidase n=1 Tax=uncultured Parasutterella sp. TaxID=1263098 RepID=UPI0025F1DDA1|nr:cytochrome c peroxidase [uncultured Parasutterella sp.]